MNTNQISSKLPITGGTGGPFSILHTTTNFGRKIQIASLNRLTYAPRLPIAGETRLILAINPGSTSDKIGIFRGNSPVLELTVDYTKSNLPKKLGEQLPIRKSAIVNLFKSNEELKIQNITLESINMIVCRGGLMQPIESGPTLVDERMVKDLLENPIMEHASNLGVPIGVEVAKQIEMLSNKKVDVLTVNPVVTEVKSHRLSGYRGIPDIWFFHALNSTALVKELAKNLGIDVKTMKTIVAHLGGGISINAFVGDIPFKTKGGLLTPGPWSPERIGNIPIAPLVSYILQEMSKFRTLDEILYRDLAKSGGVKSYLKTSSIYDVEKMIEIGKNAEKGLRKAILDNITYEQINRLTNASWGDLFGVSKEIYNEHFIRLDLSHTERVSLKKIVEGRIAELVLDAMCAYIADDICGLGSWVGGATHIILTGGIAKSQNIVEKIYEKIKYLNLPVYYFPGELELSALADEGYNVMTSNAVAKPYQPIMEMLPLSQTKIHSIDSKGPSKSLVTEGIISSMQDLIYTVKKEGLSGSVALAGINEKGITALAEAQRAGIVNRAVLVGNPIGANNFSLLKPNSFIIIDEKSDDEIIKRCIEAIKDNRANTLMKGTVSSKVFLGGILKGGLKAKELITCVTAIEGYMHGRLIFLSDPAMFTEKPETRFEDGKELLVIDKNKFRNHMKLLVDNAIQGAQLYGLNNPRIALLSSSEDITENVPFSMDAEWLAHQGYNIGIIEGPLSLDGALSTKSVKTKGLKSKLSGQADIIIVPEIIAGNIIYKQLKLIVETSPFPLPFKAAHLITGFGMPVIISSRDDEGDTKLNSIAASMLYRKLIIPKGGLASLG